MSNEQIPREEERRRQTRRIIVLAVLAVILGSLTLLRDGFPPTTVASTPGEGQRQESEVTVRLLGTPTPEPAGSREADPTDIPAEQPTPVPTVPPPAAPTTAPTAIPPDTPPLAGTYDVYLGPPDADGVQLLRFIVAGLNKTATEIGIQSDDGRAVRAGQFIYFHALSTRRPMRVNTAGAISPVEFASPPSEASQYQLLPSASGSWLAWVSVDAEGTHYTIQRAFHNGSALSTVAEGDIEPGTEIELLRLVNDGTVLFYSILPPEVADRDTPFNARYNIMMLDTRTGISQAAPGEPACNTEVVCDAHVSPDGAYLARALPPYESLTPVTVTNVFSRTVIARYEPPTSPLGIDVDLGYPFFTPGGELVYVQAIRRPDVTDYRLIFANIVTGTQQMLVDLGDVRHRPLAWTEDGLVLLTTREPNFFDTWRIDMRSGSVSKVADMMYLGSISSP